MKRVYNVRFLTIFCGGGGGGGLRILPLYRVKTDSVWILQSYISPVFKEIPNSVVSP